MNHPAKNPLLRANVLWPAALVVVGAAAHAQTIERVRMTDNDLSCQQIYTETVQMDSVIARPAQPAVAATAPDQANVGVQVAGAVAQTAIAHGAVRTGFGGFGGLGGGSLLGGLLGGVAQQAAGNANQQQAATQQLAAQQAQQSGVLTQQAQARKDHLTTMFLSRGCKLADVQK